MGGEVIESRFFRAVYGHVGVKAFGKKNSHPKRIPSPHFSIPLLIHSSQAAPNQRVRRRPTAVGRRDARRREATGRRAPGPRERLQLPLWLEAEGRGSLHRSTDTPPSARSSPSPRSPPSEASVPELTILDADGVRPRRAASPPPHTFASVATARPFLGDSIAPRLGAHLGRVFSEHGVHGRRDPPPRLLWLIGRRGTRALRVHPETTAPSCVAAPSTATSSPSTATRRCPWATGPSCSSSPAARAFRNSSAAHELSKDRFSFMLLAQHMTSRREVVPLGAVVASTGGRTGKDDTDLLSENGSAIQ
ncbi:serine/arginine repetitive matrix protein 1 [Triticum aestivum]|uniref:serine/arginine repetitive matrix protein 1 n=1 Tax=Triticum aestivum TaxID=4565 RepID=UPI001D00D012|nr:serine/arginine repetitive matrix protein 1-like [Triticum aestivum]